MLMSGGIVWEWLEFGMGEGFGKSGEDVGGGLVGWDCSWGGGVGLGGFHDGRDVSGEACILVGTWCVFTSPRLFLV